MIRTQIQLTEQQAKALKCRAQRDRVSMAALIRRSVDELLAKDDQDMDEKWKRALAAVGFLKSGPSDLARNHDKYLAEAYANEPPSK